MFHHLRESFSSSKESKKTSQLLKEENDYLRKQNKELTERLNEAERHILEYRKEISAMQKDLDEEKSHRRQYESLKREKRSSRSSSNLSRVSSSNLKIMVPAIPIPAQPHSVPVARKGSNSPRSMLHKTMSTQSMKRDSSYGEGFSIQEILDFILRPFSEDEIWTIMYMGCKVLAKLHIYGQAHAEVNVHTLKVMIDGSVALESIKKPADRRSSQLMLKYIPPEGLVVSPASDIFALGGVLWSCADFLMDAEEDPELSDEICKIINEMTEEDPTLRPTADQLIERTEEKYGANSKTLLISLLQEVERKKIIRAEYEAEHINSAVSGQKDQWRTIASMVIKGVSLKHVSPRTNRLEQQRTMSQDLKAKLTHPALTSRNNSSAAVKK